MESRLTWACIRPSAGIDGTTSPQHQGAVHSLFGGIHAAGCSRATSAWEKGEEEEEEEEQ